MNMNTTDETVAEEVVDDTEADTDTTTDETEQTETTPKPVDRAPETPEAKFARLQRQLDQHKKKHGIQDTAKDNAADTDERFARQDLKLAGIKDKKEQDIVLKYAKMEGLDAEAAMNHPVVKAALDHHKAVTATPAPSTRTSNGANNSLEYWAAQTRKGNFPPDPAIRRQLRGMNVFRT